MGCRRPTTSAVRLAGRQGAKNRCWRRRRCSGRSCCPIRSATAISNSLDPADYAAEWKWDGIRVQAVARRRHAPALFAHRRRYLRRLSRSRRRRCIFDGVARRRTAGRRHGALQCRPARFSDLQQRLNRKTVTPKMQAAISRPSCAATTCSSDGDEDLRALPLRRAARPALEIIEHARPEPLRPLAAGRLLVDWEELDGCAGAAASRHRRRDAQAPGSALSRRPAERSVVQVEARSAHRRRGADVCPARPRQALELLLRLSPSASGRDAGWRSSWCRSARPISASPTRN